MDRYSRSFTRLCGFLYTADKGGGDGGAQLTLKQQLEKAEADLKSTKAALEKAEGEKTDLQAAVDKAASDISALEQAKKDLEAKVTEANGKVTKLEGEAKTTTERAAEIAAANGVAPVKKDDEATKAASQPDGKALFTQYEKMMNDGEGVKAAEFWQTHEKALLAYSKTADARG